MPRRFLTPLAMAALLTSASACKDITSAGDVLSPEGDAADTVTIVIENFDFVSPNGTDSISVALGQTVRFINRDAAAHTATSTAVPAGEPGFDSGRLSQGAEYVWTPTVQGAYVYRCDFHPVDMSGAMILVGAALPPGSDPPPDTTGGGDTTVGPDTVLVDIVNFSFRGPDGSSRVEVSPGQTLKFVNRDEADHTVTSTNPPPGAGGFNSGNLEPGQVFYWTAPEPGSWNYVCEYHGEMTGTVVVSDSAGGGGDGTVVDVRIVDGGFVGPDGTDHVTLSLGQTVRWTNEGVLTHTASATNAPAGGEEFDSGLLQPGDVFNFTPDRAGLWEYRCDEHSDEPKGTIRVQ